MDQMWRAFGGVVPLFAVGVIATGGIVTLLVWARAGFRRRPGIWTVIFLDSLLASWALGLGLVTLLPSMIGLEIRPQIELVPFRTITQLIADSVSWQVPFVQIAGNVALFLPLGLLLRLRFGRRWYWTVLVGLTAVVAVETTQYLQNAGRVASVDDVILALLGASIGHAVAGPFVHRQPATDLTPASRGRDEVNA